MRLNPLKITAEKAAAVLPFRLSPAPFCSESYYIDPAAQGVGSHPLHHAGAYYVQEPSAAGAVTVLDPKPGDRVLDLCAGTGCLGLGIKRFCPAAQVTCVEKSPEAFVYLEKNCRCALKGQGGQTEDLLEPTAFEQADAPAFDWGPALNALRAKAKPAYAVQPVEGDLFTYLSLIHI